MKEKKYNKIAQTIHDTDHKEFHYILKQGVRYLSPLLDQRSNQQKIKDAFVKAYRVEALRRKDDAKNEFDEDIASVAQKMLYFFGKHSLLSKEDFRCKFTDIDDFIKNKNAHDLSSALKDLEVPDIRNIKDIYLTKWESVLHQYNNDYTKKLFAKADHIEVQKALLSETKTTPTPHDTLQRIEQEVAKKYFSVSEGLQDKNLYDRLGALALKYHKEFKDSQNSQNHFSSDDFAKCLEIEAKKTSKLPQILEGMNKEYKLELLRGDDEHAFILGHLTNCCQSIGGTGEQAAIDGIKNPESGFYILKKQDRIVGQGYAWLLDNGDLVIDSWENIAPEYDKIIYDMLSRPNTINLATQKKIYIGVGGKTPGLFALGGKLKDTHIANAAKEKGYSDAKEGQYLINQNMDNFITDSKTSLDKKKLKEAAEGNFCKLAGLIRLDNNRLLEQDNKSIRDILLDNKIIEAIKDESLSDITIDSLKNVLDKDKTQGHESSSRVIHAIVQSPRVLEAIKKARISFEALTSLLSVDQIQALGNYYHTVEQYSQPYDEHDKIKTLSGSVDHKLAYEFKDIKDFSASDIKNLEDIMNQSLYFFLKKDDIETSGQINKTLVRALAQKDFPQAILTNNHNHIEEFKSFKELDEKMQEVFTDPEVLSGMVNSEGKIFFSKLSRLKPEQVKAITSPNAVQAIKDVGLRDINFNSLSELEADKISAITSPNAVQAMKNRAENGINFNSLKLLDATRIKAITSLNAQAAMKDDNLKELFTYDKLKWREAKTIKLLTSGSILRHLRNNKQKKELFDTLKSLAIDKLKQLGHDDTALTINSLGNGVDLVALSELDATTIKAITSFNAVQAMKDGAENGINFNSLKSLDAAKINAITSFNAVQAMKDGAENGINFNSLKSLDAATIKAITSSNALQTIKDGVASFKTLSNLEEAKIMPKITELKQNLSIPQASLHKVQKLLPLEDRPKLPDSLQSRNQQAKLNTQTVLQASLSRQFLSTLHSSSSVSNRLQKKIFNVRKLDIKINQPLNNNIVKVPETKLRTRTESLDGTSTRTPNAPVAGRKMVGTTSVNRVPNSNNANNQTRLYNLSKPSLFPKQHAQAKVQSQEALGAGGSGAALRQDDKHHHGNKPIPKTKEEVLAKRKAVQSKVQQNANISLPPIVSVQVSGKEIKKIETNKTRSY